MITDVIERLHARIEKQNEMLTQLQARNAVLERAQDLRPTAAKVKPLEWDHGTRSISAKTTIGDYLIEDQGQYWNGDRYWVTSELVGFAMKFATSDEAKDAAQSDYEKRILSALEGGAA